MPSDYIFTERAIREFEEKQGISISLDSQNLQEIQNYGGTHLSAKKLRNILESANEKPLSHYVNDESKTVSPISVSLFVINDALWRIMEKKRHHADKMNPMITFPWFHWDIDPSGEGKEGKIIRNSNSSGIEDVIVEHNVLTIAGFAGDFAGVLEERIVREGGRRTPILVPTGFGSKELISKYNLEATEITVNLDLCEAQLYPTPHLSFDYRFFENPEYIHNHGLGISSVSGAVSLSTAGSNPVTLEGITTIYVCKRMKNLHDTSTPLKYHLWIAALYELIKSAKGD
ncbi:MAG: hypothetical protein KGY80_10955 [Candidatus Thorarchaeota archaeon]|nr:hypothetical protein [Candidatus Thorarchaeota archaeon]